MVAQHEACGAAEVCLQTRLFIFTHGDAFIVVIGERRQHECRLLADRQDAALLRAHRDAGARVGVQHAADILASRMNAAVNDETSRIDRVRAVAELVAALVDLDQARRGDFVEHQSIGIDQEMMLRPRNAYADVREDEVGPAVKRHQPVTGSKVDAQLLFFCRPRS
jgi:hypothetical protein